MVPHSPKQNFLAWQQVAATELQNNRETGWFTIAMTYALAEMASLGATTEQLNGARNFIRVLQNLWDKGETYKRLPVSRLETYEDTDIAQLVERAKTQTK